MPEMLTISVGDPVAVERGALRILVRRREVGADGGLSVEVLGEGPDELLRFDVFRDDPHYHVPASNPSPIGIDAPSHAAALDFVLACIREELPALLEKGGFPQQARLAEGLARDALAEDVRSAAARAPEPTSSRQFELPAR